MPSLAWSVVPVAQTPPSPVDDNGYVYEFYSTRPLPSFDGAKAVKNVLFRPHALRRVNKMLFVVKQFLPLLYFGGYFSGLAVLFTPASHGEWLSIVALLLDLPSLTSAYLVLRYDIVILVFKTFEFWYVTAVNIVCVGLMVYSFADLRFFMVIATGISYEIPFLMDAVYRGTTATIIAAGLGAIADLIYITVLAFSLIDQCRSYVLYSNGIQRITVDDILINGLATVVVLLSRNAYRKYQVFGMSRASRKRVGTCIMYRCCLGLRIADPKIQHDSVIPPPDAAGITQLVFFDKKLKFDGRDVMIPRWLSHVSTKPWPRHVHRLMWTVAAIGQVAQIGSHLLTFTPTLAPVVLDTAPFVSFAGALVFSAVYLAHCQPRLLLQELMGSFDYLFMSFQFMASHLCVCDLVGWDRRVVGVCASWLWSQWVITLDAVTPVMKRKLGYSVRGAIVIDILLLMEQLGLAVTLCSPYIDVYQDRIVAVLHLSDHAKEFRLIPFLFWRNFTCFLWCARLLWRLYDRRGDELLVLQGQLQYDDSMAAKRHRRKNATVPNNSTAASSSRREQQQER